MLKLVIGTVFKTSLVCKTVIGRWVTDFVVWPTSMLEDSAKRRLAQASVLSVLQTHNGETYTSMVEANCWNVKL